MLQICSFLGLCTASAHATEAAHGAAADEQPVSAVHRKLLAMLPGHGAAADTSGVPRLVLPVHRDEVVAAAHAKLRDDPSSTCQMCEMVVTYIRVSKLIKLAECVFICHVNRPQSGVDHCRVDICVRLAGASVHNACHGFSSCPAIVARCAAVPDVRRASRK